MKHVIAAVLLFPILAEAQTQPYTDGCAADSIAQIALQRSQANLILVIDPIGKVAAERYNLTCLRRIINIGSGGGLGFGLPNPWAAIGQAVCRALGTSAAATPANTQPAQ